MLVALQNESFRSLSTNLCILELSLKEFSRERYDFFPGLEKQVSSKYKSDRNPQIYKLMTELLGIRLKRREYLQSLFN